MFSKGKYTAPKIVEIAKQMGLKSKRGNRLNLDAIKYILKNPTGFYYGEWTYMGYSGKHRGLWEPIVEKKVILRNRALLKQQTSKYQKVSGKEWKFKKTNDKSRKLMIKLMTNKIIANFYKGDLPKKVLPQHNRMQLHFVWCDEFQTLFDIGIVKKAEEWDKTHKQKYMLPKAQKNKLSSKMYSRKKPVDFLLSIN